MEKKTLAESLGKTEEEIEAWIKDAPNRRNEFMEKMARNPQFRVMLDTLADKHKSNSG